MTLGSQSEATKETSTARLALAQEALVRYRTRCFWSCAGDFTATEETLPMIIEALRRHGDRTAFVLADRLCR